jgi:hypothetical protein
MVEVGSSDGRSSFTVLAALFTSVKSFTVEALKVFFYMDDFFICTKGPFYLLIPSGHLVSMLQPGFLRQ